VESIIQKLRLSRRGEGGHRYTFMSHLNESRVVVLSAPVRHAERNEVSDAVIGYFILFYSAGP